MDIGRLRGRVLEDCGVGCWKIEGEGVGRLRGRVLEELGEGCWTLED